MPRRVRTIVVAVFAIAAVACGGSEASSPSGDGTDTGRIGALLVSCGGPGFPPAALTGPPGAEGLADPAAEALRALLNSPDVDPSMLPNAGWRLVQHDGTRATFLADAKVLAAGDPRYWSVQVELTPSGWQATGWGQCRPQVVLGNGVHAGRWGLDPAAPPPNADATTLRVIVEEIECADAPPGDRVMAPLMDYSTDAITIVAVLRDLPPGAYPCPGIPGTRATFELAEPLGGRILLDGADVPPHPPELQFGAP